MKIYDEIQEVKKHDSEAKTFEEILKFNPYHDARGRFSSANGASSMTVFTNSKAGQKAIANIKAKAQAAGGGSSSGGSKPAEPTQPEQPKKKKYLMEDTQQKGHKTAQYLDGKNPDDNTYQKVANDLHVSKKKAQDMVDSVNTYSGPYSGEIRASSRGENDVYKHEADMCEEFIKASPKWAGGKLYRGIRLPDKAAADAIIAKAWKKQPIDMQGISSWSSKKSVADDFAGGGHHPVVFVTNGTSTNKGTSIRHLSKYKSENEVLMSKDAVFTPTKIRAAKDGTIYIYGDVA